MREDSSPGDPSGSARFFCAYQPRKFRREDGCTRCDTISVPHPTPRKGNSPKAGEFKEFIMGGKCDRSGRRRDHRRPLLQNRHLRCLPSAQLPGPHRLFQPVSPICRKLVPDSNRREGGGRVQPLTGSTFSARPLPCCCCAGKSSAEPA